METTIELMKETSGTAILIFIIALIIAFAVGSHVNQLRLHRSGKNKFPSVHK